MNFYIKLISRLIFDIFQPKKIKIDYEWILGILPRKKAKKRRLFCFFSNIFSYLKRLLIKIRKITNIIKFSGKWEKFSQVYYLLEDEDSKNKIIELISLNILGYRYVKLSLNNYRYWKLRGYVTKLQSNEKILRIGMDKLNLYDLNKIKIPIKIFSVSSIVLNTFILEQYLYKQNKTITAEEGNYIIDAGGFWGDSALYFANKVGVSGKVYSFEFIQNNINIFKQNIKLNPNLEGIITIIEKPLWKSTDNEFFVIENGSESKISYQPLGKSNKTIKTISIDDFVKNNRINKIDFIKMDIEGAELNALIGAKEVLIKHKPKLAISIYHNFEHFFKIPNFIKSLNLNYKFYLDHFTTYHHETILFARVD